MDKRGGAMNLRRSLLALLLIALAARSVSGESLDYRECTSCHQGIENMGKDHAFPCQECHVLPHDRAGAIKDHEKVVRFPSAPEQTLLHT